MVHEVYMEDPVSGYCDYLDKEMTIMGILSAFAVAVPAVVLDRTAGADSSKNDALAALWSGQPVLLGAGSLAFVLAALFFYRQRSLLAFYVGQLRFSKTMARYEDMNAKDLLEDADSWATWIHYQTAFALMTLGFTLYGFTLFTLVAPGQSPGQSPESAVATLSAVAVFYAVVNAFVKTRYEYHDHAWVDFFHFEEPKKRVVSGARRKR